jgi:hypothetical protein
MNESLIITIGMLAALVALGVIQLHASGCHLWPLFAPRSRRSGAANQAKIPTRTRRPAAKPLRRLGKRRTPRQTER